MKSVRTCLITALTLIFAAVCLIIPVCAETPDAEDLSAVTTVSGTGYASFGFLTDGNIGSFKTSGETAQITMESETGIAGIYLMFDLEYGEYTITDCSTQKQITAGQHSFLHEYVDLQAAFGTAPTAITLDFSSGAVRLSEITPYSQGQLPDRVQTWSAPLEGGADLVLFATHGDDDQLYFAGLLPYYAAERGYRVQVVYMTDHRNTTNLRTHEMLNGLWNVGVTTYPVFGAFADFRIDDMAQSYATYKNVYGVTEEMLMDFVVTQIRRFRPLVAVGHDLNGEYGHGMHKVYSDLLTKSVSITNDPDAYPNSAAQYGTWEIPKLYLHLYEENPITIDYDQPLAAFDGLTAFQVTQQLGFPSHETQQWPMFVNWLYGYSRQITQASQIDTYNPCEFGLYHSTVGADAAADDFFENIVSYAQQEQLELERLEQERLEQERLEQERLQQERLELERLEQERLEQERLEQERLQQELLAQAARKQNNTLLLCACAGGILLIVLFLLLCKKARKKQKQTL